MPNVVKTGGVNLTDDVFRVADVSVRRRRQATAAENPEGAPSGEAVQDDGYGYEQPVSPLQGDIIQSAMGEAADILKRATMEAEEKKQEMLAQVRYEAEKIRADAAEEGMRQGYAEILNRITVLTGELEQAVARMEGDRAGFEAEYEEQLTWMAFEIASKVLAHKVAEDDAEMLDMVAKAVRSVQNESWIRIEVSQEMTRLIGKLGELYDEQQHIQVSAVPLEPGSVQIETPSGVVDASLKTQLDNLRIYFEQSGR